MIREHNFLLSYEYIPYIPERYLPFFPPDSHLKVGGAAIFLGADCHQSSTIPPWPMCVTIQVQTATSHQPFHPGLCVSLSRGRLPPVINHSTLAYVSHYPGADCHQSSTIPPWPMCVTIQVQTATSHQPFHPGLCVSLSRCRLPPVINHSTLAYVCHYPGADCHQSSTIPPWPMCVTIQGQTATSHQPFHPGLCVSLYRDSTEELPASLTGTHQMSFDTQNISFNRLWVTNSGIQIIRVQYNTEL